MYEQRTAETYSLSIDVAVSELRAHLSDNLDQVRDGDEAVITDLGVHIARLLGLTATAAAERLAADGVIARATAALRPQRPGSPPRAPSARRAGQRPAALSGVLPSPGSV